MDFSIEDTPIDASKMKLPRCVENAIKVLEALPDGKLILGISLADRLDRTPGSWESYCNHPAIRPYKVKRSYQGSPKNLYGNRATIKAFKEQSADE